MNVIQRSAIAKCPAFFMFVCVKHISLIFDGLHTAHTSTHTLIIKELQRSHLPTFHTHLPTFFFLKYDLHTNKGFTHKIEK